MAGTRVWIASIFVLQLLVLAGLAVYFGLCQTGDMSCIPFMKQSGRTSLLQFSKTNSTIPSLSIGKHRTTVLVSNERLQFWQSTSNQNDIHCHNNNYILWISESKEIIQQLCNNPQQYESYPKLVDMILCESSSSFTTQKAKLDFISSTTGTAFFFPRAGKELIDWQMLFTRTTTTTTTTTTTLSLEIWMEHSSYTKDDFNTIQQLGQIMETEFSSMFSSHHNNNILPCVFSQQTIHPHHIITTDLLSSSSSSSIITIQNTIMSSSINDTDDFNHMETYRIPLSSLINTTTMDKKSKDTGKIVMYLPGHDYVYFHDTEKKEEEEEDSLSWLVEDPESFQWTSILTKTDFSTNQERFRTLMNTVIARCIGIPPTVYGPYASINLVARNEKNGVTTTNTTTTTTTTQLPLPRFYTKLIQQHQIQHLYTHVTQQLQQQLQMLLQSTTNIAITEDISSTWLEAYHFLLQVYENESKQEDQQEEQTNVFVLFQQILELLEQLERNPILSPPIDLSRDHYFGIFIPLLIPLLLPNLFGLFREIKRYRTKQTNNPDPQQETKEKQD